MKLGTGIALCTLFAPTTLFAQQNSVPSASAIKRFGRVPLAFEKNEGQTNSRVKYLSRGTGYSLFLTPNEAVFSLRKPNPKTAPSKTKPSTKQARQTAVAGAVVRMQLVGGNPNAKETAFAKLPGTTNYLIGKNKSQWRKGVANYSKVGFQEVYKGVDVVYYGNQKNLEYDFVVQPHTSPASIRLKFAGAKRVTASAKGELALNMGNGTLQWHAPVAYQEIAGKRTPVSAKYVLKGTQEVAFAVGNYDASKPLIIDPELAYSTYLGGRDDDYGTGIAVDSAGYAYISGLTWSKDFPTSAGAFQSLASSGYGDAFVTKLSLDGSSVIYSTLFGGSLYDAAYAIAVDKSGSAYITGETLSTDLPVSDGAYQPTYGGGDSSGYGGDAFVAKLTSDGSDIAYSTYLGGADDEIGLGIAVDTAGAAYVTGYTYSKNFPTTGGAFQGTLSTKYFSGFVTKVGADGTVLNYSTYLSGTYADYGSKIAVDANGNAYIGGFAASTDFPTTAGAYQTTNKGGFFYGSDGFVTKLATDGMSLVYSTYLGGTDDDEITGIAVDKTGNAYVTGDTYSFDFPVTPSAVQMVSPGYPSGIVTKLSSDGSATTYSTYLGGTGSNYPNSITVDSAGRAIITGRTHSSDFPTTLKAFQVSPQGGYDAFVTKLSVAGDAFVNSTLIGGSFGDNSVGVATDKKGAAYITGDTDSIDFPTNASAFQSTANGGYFGGDAIVTKLALSPVTVMADTVVTVTSSKAQMFGRVLLFANIKRKADKAPLAAEPLSVKVDGNVVGTTYSWWGNGNAVFRLDLDATYTKGSHTVEFDFAGDANNNPSSGSGTLTINNADTAVQLSSTSAKYGESKNLVGTLVRKSDGTAVAGETLTFKLDGTVIGTAVTDGGGNAALAYTVPDTLALGTHKLRAEFAGDTELNPSSAGANLVIRQTSTTTTLADNAGRIGDTIPISSTLTRNTDGMGVAGKTVTFTAGGNTIGTAVTDAMGNAVLSYKIEESLGVGKFTITASFAGDAQYSASKSRNYTLTVKKAPTKLAGKSLTGKTGTTVVFSSTLTRTTDGKALSGKSVRYQVDGVDSGTGTTDANGVVSVNFTIPTSLAAGKHTLKALFDGDTLYTATSGSWTLTVK